ncbi:hypothetical protein HDC93_000680 [Streptomyces sp. AK010]|nr:hypothetical protein [Streptomyces sp. AK010]
MDLQGVEVRADQAGVHDEGLYVEGARGVRGQGWRP